MAEVTFPCTCAPTNNVMTALSGFLPHWCARHGATNRCEASTVAAVLALQTRLEIIGAQESGPFIGPGRAIVQALPARWFALPAKVRCTSDHVATTSDPHDFIAGHCRTCGAPVALTFPEDSSGPLRA